ncbi:MAG: DUF4102 domain-containing protein, partial [Alphaproteobacteria bacterium]
MQLRLTEKNVAKIERPIRGRVEIADALFPGLVLRVSDTGKRTWALLYRVAGARDGTLKGRLRRMTLGPYPLHSLDAARTKARDALKKAEQGIDPVTDRQNELNSLSTTTFEAVCAKFIVLYAKPNVETWPNIERLLNQHVAPVWRTRQIDGISRAVVHELLDELIQRRGVGRAREVRKHLSKLFNWAVDRGMLAASPIAGMRRPELAYVARERVLSMIELRRIWDAAIELGYPFGSMIRLLLLTGQRRSEIANSRRIWLHSDLRAMEIPASEYKT